MPRATNAPATRKRRKRILRTARGYWGNKSRLYRFAKDAVDRAGQYAYRDRRKKKSEWRKLWIVRVNAACRANGISYSQFIYGLKEAGIELNRKALSEIAIHDEVAFKLLVVKVKSVLG
ncbi:MAG: 50S ribosomal protein L20 [Candidatus Moanabacter tarae]|uniref:Large ribosomal subunit protein bL20 n=1 Tax=Candidatus Moanibacter tarae TaxID=2200854 RepID=A0A2Z4AMZ8_9BACT|nr:MAG: 50S ribosomal protein L20 [Candidatus Moanabacter tarae]|tara:strand:+ start:28650 stop:29006 length:357 start_codon:yes stop_codon:yes gene_type:complete